VGFSVVVVANYICPWLFSKIRLLIFSSLFFYVFFLSSFFIMSNIYHESMKKICSEGFGDLVVEILKNKLPISFQFFGMHASYSSHVTPFTPFLTTNVGEELFW
jgi:hypothetical protein